MHMCSGASTLGAGSGFVDEPVARVGRWACMCRGPGGTSLCAHLLRKPCLSLLLRAGDLSIGDVMGAKRVSWFLCTPTGQPETIRQAVVALGSQENASTRKWFKYHRIAPILE